MPDIRVLVVDDHAILRDGIRSLLERQEGISVTGEASNGAEALEKISADPPDIVLMDIAMPVMNGIEATQRIKELYPQIKVLILTQHDDREYIQPLLQAGASGYVLKRSGGREVLSAIHQVFEQGAFLEPSIARQLLESYAQPAVPPTPATPYLTDREREVLQLVMIGKSNKEIARALHISPKTVSVHRSNIMAKLEVNNSIELVNYVNQHHILEFGANPNG
jgi:two-component system nitrate/nitrite response regulator NarL